MNLQPIYTETNDCQDCYKCIRECPNKAIKVTDNKASIIDSMCVYCGRCVEVCPTGAKKVRDGVARTKLLINNRKEVYVSLAPSYIAEYGHKAKAIIPALKKLGFKGISETALGAQEVSKQVHQFLKIRQSGIYISSACPVVVELIRKYYPQHTLGITPFMSPMLAHAKQLKKWYGKDTGVVFIGPCIAKKSEADFASQNVDVALTFKELNSWLEQEKISLNEIEEGTDNFTPYKAQHSTIYPLDGGMIETIAQQKEDTNAEFMSFSGLKNIKTLLDNLESENPDDLIFLELLACENGCINGPGMSDSNVSISKQMALRNTCKQRIAEQIETIQTESKFNIERDFFNIQTIERKSFSEAQIKDALHKIGKTYIADELNCSGCGYDSCREFAKAMLMKHAEPEMCVSHMRTLAHHKATVLLQKIPSGVIVLDDLFNVVEMNGACARLLGDEIQLCYDANPGMKGANIDKLVSFGSMFKTALQTGKEYYEVPIVENGKRLQLSIFNVQKHKLVTGILQGMAQPEFQKEIIEKRTREVINKNMETVQKIAFLLGENASYTDSLLNSILETQDESHAE
nr:[Fe-Fe] hydrogenase large subunit C-terminal domain-containing protein [uncultured Carboxylicivirga sp.]